MSTVGKDQAALVKGQLSPLLSSVRNSNISVSLEALQYVAKQANVGDMRIVLIRHSNAPATLRIALTSS